MSQATNRKEAKALGLDSYFTGKPCKRGGIADRRLNGDCLCSECLSFTKLLKKQSSEKYRDKRKQWALDNIEKIAKYKKDWQEKNKDKAKDNLKKWKSNNKESVLADFHKRRASKIRATPKWYGEFDAFVINEALRLAKQRFATTKIKWHIDHMIPLQSKLASGFHCAANIQVIPEVLNVKKRNTMTLTKPHDWICFL
jgi:hypothetical protein